MRVIRREFYECKYDDVYTIIPIGDVHIGAAACDEKLLGRVVKAIKAGDKHYWVGMGDACDLINTTDRRFDPSTLASWLGATDLVDLSKRQVEHYLGIVGPIAHKCLAFLEGNHEVSIRRRYQTNVYAELLRGLKDLGDVEVEMGFYGYLQLLFYRSKKRERASRITINLHHGAIGGKLAGAKALGMQKWLWTHECDLALCGHSHNTMAQKEAVEHINNRGEVSLKIRRGAFCGTFLRTTGEGASTYSEEKMYFPIPLEGVRIELRPFAEHESERVRVIQ